MAEEKKKHPNERSIVLKASSMESNPNGALKSSSKMEVSGSKLEAGEVQKMSKRLEILEEDIKAMKKALFEAVEERRNLVEEINQQFQIVRNRRKLHNKAADGFSALEDDYEILNLHKERRQKGILEIFHRRPNLCLVIKDLKANVTMHLCKP